MSYYSIQPSATIKDVLKRWQSGDKAYDEVVHNTYAPEDVWPYREYTWSRDNARRSPEEFDELEESMRLHGWDPKDPAIVILGKRDGRIKVGEGNHRLAIAMRLGIKVPVRFEFYDRAY